MDPARLSGPVGVGTGVGVGIGVAVSTGVGVRAGVGVGLGIGDGVDKGTANIGVGETVGPAVVAATVGEDAGVGTRVTVEGNRPPQAATSKPRAKTVAKQVSHFTALAFLSIVQGSRAF